MEELGVVGQILLFAIIIIISIAQQVMKNKQKRRASEASREQASHEYEASTGDYYDERNTNEEDTYQWGSDGEPFTLNGYEGRGSAVYESAPPYGYGEVDSGLAESNVPAMPVPSAYDNADKDEPGLEGLIEAFDLRSAVIYSELLNPKFEE